MLERLYVTNYRCLVNFEFKPNSKQLLIGNNGSGKTTVLDVLALLRDFAGRGLDCEDRLGGRTRTIWQDVAEQRFALDVRGNGGLYKYQLDINEWGSPSRPRVDHEWLEYDGKPLFRFGDGEIEIYDEDQKGNSKGRFPCDWHRSGLASIIARPDNKKLTWFKQWLNRLVQVKINPWAMSARSEREAREPAYDLSNFADWYRHLKLESGREVFQAIEDLREVIPGLESLDAKEAGLDVRVIQATIRSRHDKPETLSFDELSEGQRVLIALYLLLHCALVDEATLLIDEPDNFIALAEIQPWLMKLLDRVDEQNAQVILVSHHPELLNQLAAQGGLLLDRPNGAETRIKPFAPPDDTGLTPAEIVALGWEDG
ncbi:MAG: AAA family ATPase [Planctomycetes bacterium]|nr:AAA family ATPase [Planctomycetota bacterium]